MYIYKEADIRSVDQLAEEQGFSPMMLMENAGRSLFYHIKNYVKKSDKIAILAGKGNNGGDGIVLARYLTQAGYDISLILPMGESVSDAAKQHLAYYKKQSYTLSMEQYKASYDVLIDALLGIGTTLPLRKEVRDIIQWCNACEALKIAIDLPTGVTADHGQTVVAFKADVTFCLHGVKPSALLLPSGHYYGKYKVVPLGVKQSESNIRWMSEQVVKSTLPKRERATHKGTFGTALIVAGSDDMPGSAVLCAIGAIRCGVGKLVMASTTFAATSIIQHVPEATLLIEEKACPLGENIDEKTRAIAIGPGLGNQEKTTDQLRSLLQVNLPLVVDAGALLPSETWKRPSKTTPTILTPHPGEFSRLTGFSVAEIQANRMELARQYAMENHVTVVLKGEHTVIAYPDGMVIINSTGNSGLAKGGSGDILTGMLTSMLATHTDWRHAIVNAVYIHGRCAELWASKYSDRSMVASDFKQLLPEVLRQLEVDM